MDQKPLDRPTLDRVLQRAAELQAASMDPGDSLSEDELVALGTEVGIPAQHVRQALLEERTRAVAPRATGLLDHWVAPADFVAQRVVQGSQDGIGAALVRWMERQEQFVVQRASGGDYSFEPMDAIAGAVRRVGAMFDARGKPYLSKAELVTAVITPLEPGFCHVSLAASLHAGRRAAVTGGAALGVGGAALGASMLAFTGLPLLGIPVIICFAVSGAAVARQFRSRAHRAQLGLERALDDLQRNSPAGTPLDSRARLARGVGQVVRGITQEVRKAFDE